MSGYVRIHRTLIGHPVFRNDAEAMVFAWLITQAQWKPTRVRYRDHIIKLERGQLAISLRDLAHRFDRDKAWVGRLLKRLENESMIETAGETGVTVITLCNYNDYQSDPVLCETASEPRGETGATQGRDTEQEREERKKGNTEPKGSSPRGWVCPSGVDQSHWRDFLRNRKTKRLTNSETAYLGQLRELDRLSDDEWPPGRLVQHAAEKGWGSIHDPRTPMNGTDNVRELRRPGTNPLVDLYRAATDAENRQDHYRDRPALPPAGNG